MFNLISSQLDDIIESISVILLVNLTFKYYIVIILYNAKFKNR